MTEPKIITFKQHKTVEVIPVELSSVLVENGKAQFQLLCFTTQDEFAKEVRQTDLLNGMIPDAVNYSIACFLKDVMLLARRNNPKLMYFILRKKP